MIRRPPRSTLSSSSAASDVYKRQKMLFAAILKSLNRQLIIDKNVPALLAFLGGPLYFFTPLVSFNKEIVALIHMMPVSYTHLRAHETPEHLVCRLLLEKKKNPITSHNIYSH
eukprot:TRINITY_DN15307_c0_g1_i1.p1 TRINITY_DN15307_c0_g1~~TRINITY_DN15307_c0_g1_i1.p1  ORF type:complete len:113 (-),score=25.30 TRINITY_DN15307_c0_g1_i1:22-360(-)